MLSLDREDIVLAVVYTAAVVVVALDVFFWRLV
jgi:hypothetical protein